MGAEFSANTEAILSFNTGCEYIDETMHCVGTIKCACGSLDDLDCAGLFRVSIEQLIDITEPTCTQWNTVLGHQERTTTSGTGEHGGAQCGQVFLSIAAANPGTGHALQCFIDVGMTYQLQRIAADSCNV